MRSPLSRRTVLRGLLGGTAVTLSLPFLEAMLPLGRGGVRASTTGFPLRFGLFFWGNGNIPDLWTPTGEGKTWELSPQLAPFANVKDVISVVTGMSIKIPNIFPHGSGSAGILAAAPQQELDGSETCSTATIDQVIAAQIGGETLYRSLQTAGTDIVGLSYNGPNNRNPAEYNPYAFYERLFGSTFREPGEEGIVDPTIGLRRSVLDAVMGDVDRLKKRVGAADSIRLEQHLDGIRELETRLARLEEDPPNLESCSRPPEPLAEYPDQDGRPQVSARSRALCDMLAMALACDQTRVFSHYLTEPVNNTLFPDASDGHHNLTHDEPDDQPQVHAITVQCVTEMAYLVEALRAVPEGDGTLLDSCAVLGCSEVSLGRLHSLDEMPVVIAGSAAGALRTGVHYRSYSQENVSTVLLSLIRAMGINQSEYGVDEGRVTDGLSAIEV